MGWTGTVRDAIKPCARLLDLVRGRSGQGLPLTPTGCTPAANVHHPDRHRHPGPVRRLRQRDPRRARRHGRRARRLPRRPASAEGDGGRPPPGPATAALAPRSQARPALPDSECPARRRREAIGLPDHPDRGRAAGWRPALRGHRRPALLPTTADSVPRPEPWPRAAPSPCGCSSRSQPPRSREIARLGPHPGRLSAPRVAERFSPSSTS